ncbi:MAG TPA: hypothetical protein VHW24_20070 [Bryobacteraceae bacterium]|jgi:hypothetical protein|nr:hypothetical protein [Bryobacteraceae bacterium]
MPVTLTIRAAQLKLLSQTEQQKFEAWMLRHLERFFPEECRASGTQAMAEFVAYGRARAARYGFTSRRDVCKYIDLMMVFGRDFDVDENLPWAAPILARKGDAAATMRALFAAAIRRLR